MCLKLDSLSLHYGSQYSKKIILANRYKLLYKFGLFQISVSLWGWSNRENFLPLKKSFAWQHKMTACCETVIQLVYHIVLWGPGGTKLWNPDTFFVFEVVPSHLVLGNKHSRTWWEFTLLPSFIMEVKSELMHEQQCSFVCYNVFCIILCAKCKKKLFMLQSKFWFF